MPLKNACCTLIHVTLHKSVCKYIFIDFSGKISSPAYITWMPRTRELTQQCLTLKDISIIYIENQNYT